MEELEQEQLNDRLMGAERAPVHSPLPAAGTTHAERRERKSFLFLIESRILADAKDIVLVIDAKQIEEEDDEEAQLRQLQAEMAM